VAFLSYRIHGQILHAVPEEEHDASIIRCITTESHYSHLRVKAFSFSYLSKFSSRTGYVPSDGKVIWNLDCDGC
jgi:hypothetical protein